MDYSTLVQWCNEPFGETLKVKEIERFEDQFRLSFINGNKFLQINLSGENSFCFFTETDILDFKPTLSGISNVFKNALLSKIKILGNDRIICFEFEKNSIYGEKISLKIVVELITGKQNLIFLQEHNILSAKKFYTFAENPQRQILPKIEYKTPESKNTHEFSPLPLPLHDEDYSFNSVNAYLEHFYYKKLYPKKLAVIKQKNEKIIEKQITKERNSLRKLEETLKDYDKLEFWRMSGELLKGNFAKIPIGVEEIKLVNYYDPNLPEISLKLKRDLSPRQNIEHYFKKYKKALLGKEILEKQISSKKSTIADLENKTQEISIVKRSPAKKKTEKKEYKELKIDEYIKIMIGRNNVENNKITCNIAGKTDLWFHTRAIKGSHVVIFNPFKKNISMKLMEIAASLAAYYSKAKHSEKVAVDWTQIRYVWKRKGADMGQVNYKNQKTLFVSPKSIREIKNSLMDVDNDTTV